jgi:hypothetical protein
VDDNLTFFLGVEISFYYHCINFIDTRCLDELAGSWLRPRAESATADGREADDDGDEEEAGDGTEQLRARRYERRFDRMMLASMNYLVSPYKYT